MQDCQRFWQLFNQAQDNTRRWRRKQWQQRQVSISPTFCEQLLRQNPFSKKLRTQNIKHLKAVQRTLVWLSISPIFYKQLFHSKVLCAPFMCQQFGFVIFWQKDFGAKAAHKMLVKLTPGCQRYFITDSSSNYPEGIQLAKLVIFGAPLWLNQPDSLTLKSCFGRAFLPIKFQAPWNLKKDQRIGCIDSLI